MIDVFLFILLTAVAIILLILPYLRRQAATPRETFDLAVHQDQLAELDRDLERGVIDAEAARAARVEIQRRILALAEQEEAAAPLLPHQGRTGWIATVLVVIVVPVASALVYFQTGRPHLKDVPLAARILPEQQVAGTGRASALANIQDLQQRVQAAPEDAALWVELARTQLQAGLFGDAIGSYGKAVELTGAPMLRAEMGEAIVQGAEGLVTPAALEQFRAVLASVPDEPRAHYYIGLAASQEGDVDGAVESWRRLLEVSPSDASFRPQIVRAIRSVLEANGRPADEVIASLPEGGAAAAGVPLGENEQIRGMVEGLAARLENEPDDLQGWLMLGRSRMVLEEPELARQAYERAKALAPENPEVMLGYASSLLQPSETPGGDPIVGDEAVAIYEQLVDLAPEDPEPRWLLGLAAAQAGDKDRAIDHWQSLLSLIDEKSEDHGIVKARITALESDEPAATIAAGAAPSLNGLPHASTEETSPPRENGPQPTAEDMAEMAALSADDRNQRIRSMVDGLAARLEDDPDDIEGWLRLAQSRKVLGEDEAANEAYRRAMEIEPESPEVIRAFASSLLGAPHPETNVATVGQEAAGLYGKLVKLDPDDPEANWYLGLAAVQDGEIDEAKTRWQRVLDVLGPDHPNYAAVQSSLQQVETRTQ